MNKTIALLDGDIAQDVGTVWVGSHGYLVYHKDSLVHRYVVEKTLGRKLKRTEFVHHINQNKRDARRVNLLVCEQSYHALIHMRMRILECGYNPDEYLWCSYHKKPHKIEEFSTSPTHVSGYNNFCRQATNEYRKAHGLNRDKFDWRARLAQQYRRIFKEHPTGISKWV